MESEAPTKHFRIAWLSPVILVTVAVLAVAEIGFRLPAVQQRLPEPNPYYDIGVETRLRALHAWQPLNGQLDVLFIGSSVVRTNIDPALFDSTVALNSGEQITSFNGGLSALNPDLVRFYFRRFWLEHAHPKVVVQAVRLEELHSDVVARSWYRFKQGRFERWWVSDGFLDRLSASLYSHSRLLYYQGTWSDRLVQGWSDAGTEHNFPITATGYGPTHLTLREALATGRLPAAPPVYRDDYQPQEFATQLAALARTDSMARANGMLYVLVNMPEHCARYDGDPRGQARYQAYLDVLGGFARSLGIPLIDVTGGDAGAFCNDAWFSDYHHMSPAGAQVFTTMLAQAFAPLWETFDQGGAHPAAAAARVTTSSAIDSDAVAAGLGALSTCTAPGRSRNTKSCTRVPSGAMAWARTPAPPGSRSSARSSGTSF